MFLLLRSRDPKTSERGRTSLVVVLLLFAVCVCVCVCVLGEGVPMDTDPCMSVKDG